MGLETNDRFWQTRGESGIVETDLPIGRIREEASAESGRGGVLGTYLSGRSARAWANAGATTLEEAIAQVEVAHPGLRERLVSAHRVSWDDEPFARGAYAYFGPNRLTTLFDAAGAHDGAVHFAGDGTSHRPGFMHGAVASARRVVEEIVRTVG
jgi:monoamine oxidase